LDGLREALRSHDYLPILFDFEKPASHNLTETISTVAHIVFDILVWPTSMLGNGPPVMA